MKVSCCAQTRVAGSSLPTVKSDCLWWSPLFSRCLRLCKSANKHGMKTFCKETGFSRTNSNFFGFFVCFCFCFCFCFFFLRVWNLQSLTDHLGTKDEQTIIFLIVPSVFWRHTIRLSKFAARTKTVLMGASFIEKSFRIKDSTLGTTGFSRVRREFSVFAEGRHIFGPRPKQRLDRDRKSR